MVLPQPQPPPSTAAGGSGAGSGGSGALVAAHSHSALVIGPRGGGKSLVIERAVAAVRAELAAASAAADGADAAAAAAAAAAGAGESGDPPAPAPPPASPRPPRVAVVRLCGLSLGGDELAAARAVARQLEAALGALAQDSATAAAAAAAAAAGCDSDDGDGMEVDGDGGGGRRRRASGPAPAPPRPAARLLGSPHERMLALLAQCGDAGLPVILILDHFERFAPLKRDGDAATQRLLQGLTDALWGGGRLLEQPRPRPQQPGRAAAEAGGAAAAASPGPAPRPPLRLALVGATCRQDGAELLEKRARSRFSLRRLLCLRAPVAGGYAAAQADVLRTLLSLPADGGGAANPHAGLVASLAGPWNAAVRGAVAACAGPIAAAAAVDVRPAFWAGAAHRALAAAGRRWAHARDRQARGAAAAAAPGAPAAAVAAAPGAADGIAADAATLAAGLLTGADVAAALSGRARACEDAAFGPGLLARAAPPAALGLLVAARRLRHVARGPGGQGAAAGRRSAAAGATSKPGDAGFGAFTFESLYQTHAELCSGNTECHQLSRRVAFRLFERLKEARALEPAGGAPRGGAAGGKGGGGAADKSWARFRLVVGAAEAEACVAAHPNPPRGMDRLLRQHAPGPG